MVWTLEALPSTPIIATAPARLADPKFALSVPAVAPLSTISGETFLATPRGTFPVYAVPPASGPFCIILPLDGYLDIRARFAVRLWRGLRDQPPGDNPAALTRYRRDLLVRQLRALDGKLDGASHGEIARVLFGKPAMSASAWASHDARARADRAIRTGLALMGGQYRQLLLHPYRRTVPKHLLARVDLARP